MLFENRSSVLWRRIGLFDTDRAGLELRNSGDRVESGIGQQVGASLAAPVEGDEQRVHPDGPDELRLDHGVAAPGHQPDHVAGPDAEVAGHLRVDLDVGFRFGLVQRRDAAGLRAGLVLRQHAAGRQPERVVLVRLLRRGPVMDRVEAGLAVGGREAVEEQARRSRRAPSSGQGQKTPCSAAMRS